MNLLRIATVRIFQTTTLKNTKLNHLRCLQTSVTHLSSHTLEYSPNAKLNKTVAEKFSRLPLPDKTCLVEYVWIDGTGLKTRSKSRTLDFVPTSHQDVPNWAYDGSSTYQAQTENSDTTLCPVAIYNDPFRGGKNKIVLCETFKYDGKPTETNLRHNCYEAVNKICDHEPLFGIEQEYQLMDVDGRPFGWPCMHGDPAPAGPYYCGVGAKEAYGRDIAEAHYRACLYAGVDHEGVNAEVTLAQWEYQVGVCKGIKCADDNWMARYILDRVAEEFGVSVSLDPKILSHWNGAGMHTNFSSKLMREENGITHIETAIKQLGKRHLEHMQVYDPNGGQDNLKRMTGKHETADYNVFSWGVASRKVSVRIGRSVAEKKKGYFEDRRPASNADPYAVCNALIRTIYLDDGDK